ncbi:unnamed protein product [Pleuronectes platessa]|uniref:Uncharacterized protein n=1 Tax=Pleuronectes platessa TaxID=8262 RepID=A0A9N7V049_PLEPL|nr:unnamed protein product [Pleuronectes platessa]
MADRGVDLSALPKEVRDQLAELDLELSEALSALFDRQFDDGLRQGLAIGRTVSLFISCRGTEPSRSEH